MKCAMPCPRIYLPVCGSDGQTHANRCEMKRYACEHDTELEVVHLGKCTGPSKRPDVQTGVWGWAAEWSVGEALIWASSFSARCRVRDSPWVLGV
jgi:hypothetical protein